MVILSNLHLSAIPLLITCAAIIWAITVVSVLFTISKINKAYKSNS